MALKLKGSTSGFVAIDAPSVAGNNTLILPENTGSAHQILANDITAGVTTFTQITVSRNGDLTVPGTISIGGTLTYEDVTSVDSVGIVTARGLSIFGNTTGLSVSGIATITKGTSGGAAANSDAALILDNSTQTYVQFRTPNNKEQGLLFGDDADNDAGAITYSHSTNHIGFKANGSERMRIDSSGKIGINNSSPSYTLTVNGDEGVYIAPSSNSTEGVLSVVGRNSSGTSSAISRIKSYPSGSNNTADMAIETRNSSSAMVEAIRITSNQSVGINTVSPNRRFTLYQDATTRMNLKSLADSTVGIEFGDPDDENIGYIVYDNTNNSMQFGVNAGERLRIDSAGKVGINRTPTQHPLEVQHASEPTISLWTGSTKKAALQVQSNGTYIYSYENAPLLFSVNSAQGFTERMRIGNDGRILMGTTSYSNISSNAVLTLKSSGSSATRLNLENSGSSSPESTQIFSQNNELAFITSGSEALRIESDGFLKLKANCGLSFVNQTRTSTTNYSTSVTGEKLDYYEEGTLNPTAISAGLTFQTSGDTKLRYVRIGHWVSVSGYLQVVSYTSNSNVIKIAMPFTSAANSEGYYTRGLSAIMYRYVNLSSNYDQLVGYVGGNENYMRLFQSRSSSGDWQELKNSNLASNTAAFYFSVNYMVAA